MASEVVLMKAAEKLQPVIDDLYSTSKGKAAQSLKKFKNNKRLNELYKEISSVLRVKTIWQTDKRVNLKQFYYPAKTQNSDKPISSISKISEKENILIQGTVGQGKSMFMRYMTAQEMAQKKRIPVFFELRYIEKENTLRSKLMECLSTLNFDCDDNLFDTYAKTGKFVFFLDGFDETPTSMRTGLINELDMLSRKYPDTQIVISSRPDSGIEFSHNFEIERLAELEEEDIPKLIDKLSETREQSEFICGEIKSKGQNIVELLRTPLMVTLLVIAYKSEQKIPENFTEFYESLFMTLLSKHDKTKPGYFRERRCSLNDRNLEKAFEAFCFVTRKYQKGSLTPKEAFRFSEEASSLSQLSFDEQSFIEDITKVTCLLTEEGLHYYFIHKSIQEFFAASFIQSLPDNSSEKFYCQLRDGAWNSWQQELSFLSEIDKYNYYKNFMIPLYEQELSKTFNEKGKYRSEYELEFISKFSVFYKKDLEQSNALFYFDFNDNFPLYEQPQILIMFALPAQFLMEEWGKKYEDREKAFDKCYEFAIALIHKIASDKDSENVTALDFLEYSGKTTEGRKYVKKFVKNMRENLRLAKSYVEHMDNLPNLISI